MAKSHIKHALHVPTYYFTYQINHRMYEHIPNDISNLSTVVGCNFFYHYANLNLPSSKFQYQIFIQ